MPYIGQRPATGEANSFKILDEISSYTLTFDGSSAGVVSLANDTITEREHRFVTGQRVTYNDGGGTAITGLSDGVYYVIVEDRHTIKLASSATNASNGTAINLQALGVGASHTLNVAFDGVNTKFKATVDSGTKAGITRSGQLMLSINGVLQEPHDNTDSPTTGYATDHTSTIIFSAAPAATDQFFGRLIASNFATFDISDNTVDNFTGDGSTTTFTLSKTPASNGNVLVTIDGVVQYPDDSTTIRAYTVSENILDFASAPGNGVEIQVRHIGFAGATSGGGGVTGFYGRAGNAVLKSTDSIVFNNATASGTVEAANVTVTGNLTVEGTTTTLDTELTSVDKLEVAANNTTVAAAITQTGTGDILNLYDGATEVFTVTDGGRVGIGTFDVDSAVKLQVNAAILMAGNGQGDGRTGIEIGHGSPGVGTAHHRIRTGGGSGQNLIIEGQTAASGGDVIFKTGGTNNRLRITSAGNIGINQANPQAKLQVDQDASDQSGAAALKVVGTAYGTNKSIHSYMGTTSSTKSLFYAENSNGVVMNVAGNGTVGIGTDNPSKSLSILSSQSVMMQLESTSDTARIGFKVPNTSNSPTIGVSDEEDLQFRTGGAERLRIISDGKVGIGLTNPLSRLHLSDAITTTNNILTLQGTSWGDGEKVYTTYKRGSVDLGRVGVEADGAGNAGQMIFEVATGGSPVERLRITSDGKVGIGTNNPTTNIHNYNAGDVTILNDAVGGDSTIDIRNSGNGNWSGIDFIRERSTGTNVTGGSIWMPSVTANNSALLYIQTQSASAQSGVDGALSANNGVRLKLASQPGGVAADTAFTVEMGATERFRITSDGNVGINTTTIVDGAHFQHYQSSVRHQSFQSTNGDLSIVTDNNSAPAVYIKGTGNADLVNVFDNTTEVFTILDGGNVGINTITPVSYGNSQATLVIEDDANPAICLSDTGQTRDWWFVGLSDGLGVRYADGGGSGSASNVTSSMFFKNNGDVGVNQNSPLAPLHVHNPDGGNASTKAEMGSEAVLRLQPHTTNSTNMQFASINNGNGIGIQVTNGPSTANWNIGLNPFGGNVGLGQTNPAYLLDVKTTTNQIARFETTSTADMAIELKNSQGTMYFGLGGGEEFAVATTANLNGASENLFAIKQDGKVGINQISPAAQLHVSGGNIRVDSGYGIDFAATSDSLGTKSSEVLDDYEEGSWTPQYKTENGGSSGISHHTQSGTYVKIGKLVYIELMIATSDWSSGVSGDIYIQNLPYTMKGSSGAAFSLSFRREWDSDIGENLIGRFTNISDVASIKFYKNDTNSGSTVSVVHGDFMDGSHENYVYGSGCYQVP